MMLVIMVDKAILEELRKASYWEESFIVKYDNDSMWALLKSLPDKKFNRINELFKQNLKDTSKHSKMLMKLVKDIEGGKLEL